mgnify:CR=1 FL=1
MVSAYKYAIQLYKQFYPNEMGEDIELDIDVYCNTNYITRTSEMIEVENGIKQQILINNVEFEFVFPPEDREEDDIPFDILLNVYEKQTLKKEFYLVSERHASNTRVPYDKVTLVDKKNVDELDKKYNTYVVYKCLEN